MGLQLLSVIIENAIADINNIRGKSRYLLLT